MEASQNGHEEVVRILLSAGANVDLQDKVSSTSPAQGPLLLDCMYLYGFTGKFIEYVWHHSVRGEALYYPYLSST